MTIMVCPPWGSPTKLQRQQQRRIRTKSDRQRSSLFVVVLFALSAVIVAASLSYSLFLVNRVLDPSFDSRAFALYNLLPSLRAKSPVLILDETQQCDTSYLSDTSTYKCLVPDGLTGSFATISADAMESLTEQGQVIEFFPPELIRRNDVDWYGRRFNNLLSISHAVSMARACGKLLTLPRTLNERTESGIPSSYFDCVDFRRAPVPPEILTVPSGSSTYCRESYAEYVEALTPRDISKYWLIRKSPTEPYFDAINADAKRVTAAYWGFNRGSYRCRSCPHHDSTIAYIRSGDLFDYKETSAYPKKGQPPLDFFVKSIRASKATTVTVFAEDWKNPVTQALKDYDWTADNGAHVELDVQVSGDYEQVLRMVFCARTLITANTSMLLMTAYGANLKKLYLGKVDGLEITENGQVVGTDNWNFHQEDTSSRLMAIMTDTQVYGYVADDSYSVYRYWRKKKVQRQEMLTYKDGILVRLI